VHGLLLDTGTGRLDWVVNGYDAFLAKAPPGVPGGPVPKAGDALGALGTFKDFAMGEMKFPDLKIGETAARIGEQLAQQAGALESQVEQKIAPVVEPVEQVMEQVQQYAQKNWPQPPPIRMRPPPLPPMKKKIPPPPIRPGRDFGRG
jgi:hypothetical protein